MSGKAGEASIGDGYLLNPYVVAWPEGSEVVVKSVRCLRALQCSWPIMQALLQAEGDGHTLRRELSRQPGVDASAVIQAAREADILVSESRLTETDQFFTDWTWGPVAAAFLFGYHTDAFGKEEAQSALAVHAAALLPKSSSDIVALPPLTADDCMNTLLSRRRSRRSFEGEPLDLAVVAACLSDALGLTGEVILDDGRKAPLTAAPAPGGRNTYDGVVLARRVKDLPAGTYRYLPQHHALAPQTGETVPFDRLFGGQSWCAEASCAIVLTAELRRQATRYEFPTTIAATLIEAGARSQLMLVRAEQAKTAAVILGLAGVGAFDQALASSAGLPCDSMSVPVCAILLGPRMTDE